MHFSPKKLQAVVVRHFFPDMIFIGQEVFFRLVPSASKTVSCFANCKYKHVFVGKMKIGNLYTSVACNRTSNAVDWNVWLNIIAFGNYNSVSLARDQGVSIFFML